jgi:hypothetical protein
MQYIQWIQESKLRLISQSMNVVDETQEADIIGERAKVSVLQSTMFDQQGSGHQCADGASETQMLEKFLMGQMEEAV